MKKQISSRDWETLSAYVDGQLSNRERARLETRLQKDESMQAALEELRSIRNMLRSLPEVRAPRNFTLRPEMVPQHRPPARAYPILGLASAMATILLALVFLGDFLLAGRVSSAPQMAAFSEPTSHAVAELPAAPAEVPAAEADLRSFEEAAPAGQEIEETEQGRMMAIQPEATGELTALATPTAVPGLALDEGDPEAYPSPSQALEEEDLEAYPAESQAVGEEESSAPDKMAPYPMEQPAAPGETLRVADDRGNRDPVLIVKLILASVAVSTGFAALYLRNRAARL